MTPLNVRRRLARLSLKGLSIGDAFGQQFFSQPELLAARELPVYPWTFTDDTVMGIAVTQTLEICGKIDQQDLARRLGEFYAADPHRGYGATAHLILRAIANGSPWRQVSAAAFDGTGSMGNGAAMRVGPVGAWFFDDRQRAAREARLSAEVTHTHAEGIAGAVAVAVAAAVTCAWNVNGRKPEECPNLIQTAMDMTDRSQVRNGLEMALAIRETATVHEAAARLGSGRRILAQDTVPFALWCAHRHLHDYPEAMWQTASVFGDMDTNCAIVGSITALAGDENGIPQEWLLSRESLIG